MKTNVPQTTGISRNMIYLFIVNVALVALAIFSSCSSTRTEDSYIGNEGIEMDPSVEESAGANSSVLSDSSETSSRIKEKTRQNLIHWISY